MYKYILEEHLSSLKQNNQPWTHVFVRLKSQYTLYPDLHLSAIVFLIEYLK